MEQPFWFAGWGALGRVLAMTVLGYAALILTLRVSGKRTLSKMNAFDFVVTVALGSTLASLILSKQVTLSEGALALGTLIFLQYAITWASVRSKAVERWVKNRPRLLLYRGEPLEEVMRRERVTREEIAAALREAGCPDPGSAHAVVLETNGTLSVLEDAESDRGLTSSLEPVEVPRGASAGR